MSTPEATKASPTSALPTTTTVNNPQTPVQTSHPSADIEKEATHTSAGDSLRKDGYTQDIEKSSSQLRSSLGRESLDGRNNINGTKELGDVGTAADLSSEEDDANVVWWDGPDDPHNPLNFSKSTKIVIIAVISGITFVTPLASSMFTPGVPQLMEEFKSTNIELGSFVVSVYVLGFAFGPLLFAPLSEIYGRLPIYHLCNVGFLLFTIACALATNLNMLIGFRFLAGTFGSAPLVNGGGSIADIFIQEERGLAMALFAIGPIIGPVLGPVAGGYLTEAKGWRWVFWVLSMVAGFFTILSLTFMRETFAMVILQRKTDRLRKETRNPDLRSKLDSGLSNKDYFIRSIIRPAKMLVFSPIVLVLSVYVGIVYGYLYLLFTTFSLVFRETYHFSTGSVGLSFLGIGIGSFLGLGLIGWSSDKLLKQRAAEADAVAQATGEPAAGLKPEFRLPPLLPASVLLPAGFLIYGWTAHYHVHYVVPIMSTGLIGLGNIAIFMVVSMYLIDAYNIYAASALATNTVVRSVLGAVLPLAGQKMYKALGLGWGNSLLAFIAMLMIPVPWVILKWGEKLRLRFPVKNL